MDKIFLNQLKEIGIDICSTGRESILRNTMKAVVFLMLESGKKNFEIESFLGLKSTQITTLKKGCFKLFESDINFGSYIQAVRKKDIDFFIIEQKNKLQKIEDANRERNRTRYRKTHGWLDGNLEKQVRPYSTKKSLEKEKPKNSLETPRMKEVLSVIQHFRKDYRSFYDKTLDMWTDSDIQNFYKLKSKLKKCEENNRRRVWEVAPIQD